MRKNLVAPTTERPEGLDADTLHPVGTSEEGIFSAFFGILDDPVAHEATSRASNSYGDGRASELIADV